jgi:hypothetical protein
MRFLTRTLLAWLLVLTIPVQGFAATAMLLCASGHQSNPRSVQMTLHAASQSETQAAAPSNHLQHQAAHGTSHAGHDAAHTNHADAEVTSHAHAPDKGKCSACASCCVGTALVAAPFISPVSPVGNLVIAFTLAVFASYVPEGLDPPPRSFLA